MSKKDLVANNHPVKIYQDGEFQIDISQRDIRIHLEYCDEALKDSLPLYLRECDLRAMLKLIEDDRSLACEQERIKECNEKKYLIEKYMLHWDKTESPFIFRIHVISECENPINFEINNQKQTIILHYQTGQSRTAYNVRNDILQIISNHEKLIISEEFDMYNEKDKIEIPLLKANKQEGI